MRQPFALCLHARPLPGSPGGDQVETSEARWFTTGDIPALPIQPAIRRRIDHALAPAAHDLASRLGLTAALRRVQPAKASRVPQAS